MKVAMVALFSTLYTLFRRIHCIIFAAFPPMLHRIEGESGRASKGDGGFRIEFETTEYRDIPQKFCCQNASRSV
jgi:hypothetical protein